MAASNTSPEQRESARQVFDIIDGLEPDRNPAATAIDQIAGSGLAKGFLVGYADHLASAPDGPLEADPLDAAMSSIRHMAHFAVMAQYVQRPRSIEEQLQEIMNLWTQAYDELTSWR